MLSSGRELICSHLQMIIDKLKGFAHEWAGVSMLSRTHGQHASPTTVGKEMANVAARLEFAVLLPVTTVEKLLLVLGLFIVLIVEILNSAIEAVVDRFGWCFSILFSSR